MKDCIKKIWNSIYDTAYMAMAFLVAYFVDVLLIFLLAYLVFEFRWSDRTVGLCVHGIFVFGGALAALIVVRYKKLRRWLVKCSYSAIITGVLSGMIYAGILLFISVVLTKSTLYMKQEWMSVLFKALCGCIIGSTVGLMGTSSTKKTSSQP